MSKSGHVLSIEPDGVWPRNSFYGQPLYFHPALIVLHPKGAPSSQLPHHQGFSDFLNQYTANRRRWLKHGDSIVEQTSKNAINWLKEKNS